MPTPNTPGRPARSAKPAYHGGRHALVCRTHNRVIGFIPGSLEKGEGYVAKGCRISSAIIYNGLPEERPHA